MLHRDEAVFFTDGFLFHIKRGHEAFFRQIARIKGTALETFTNGRHMMLDILLPSTEYMIEAWNLRKVEAVNRAVGKQTGRHDSRHGIRIFRCS